MRLRVGVLGIGDAWEHRHRPALRAVADRFEVRAVYEQIGHRAKMASAEFQADPVDGFRALTAREDVDAILMLSPQWCGSLPVLAACAAGKAVYFGGGVELEPEWAETVRQAVERAGVAFVAERLRRNAPATQRLKELIATRLGPPRLLFCHHRLPNEPKTSRCGTCRPARTLVQELAEQVEWCRYVVGAEPHWVTGVHHAAADGVDNDYQMMSLGFSPVDRPGSGAVAQISCGRYFPASWHEAITYRPLAALQVCCEKGLAFVDLPSTVVWFDEAGRHQELLDSERPIGEQRLVQFHRAVESLVRKNSDLEDVCRTLAIVLRAVESARLGTRLTV
jgi:predicted dehydrogenase